MSEIKKLWHFRQNNSGGFYTGPAYHIVVEADNVDEAWDEAEKLGATNDDSCPCCGERWYSEPWEIENRNYVFYADSAIEDQEDSRKSIPLVIGCPEWRKGEFRVSMEFENFSKKCLT